MMTIRKARSGRRLLAALLVLTFAACTRDADESDGREARLAEVDRKLDLALLDAASEPELRDVGEPAQRPGIQRPQPPGPAESSAATTAPAPEPVPKSGSPGAGVPPPPDPELPPEEPEGTPESGPRPLPAPDPVEPTGTLATLERAPIRETESHTVPGGTTFQVELAQRLSTEWSRPGDKFMATLSDPILDGDREIVPAGASVMGEVTRVRPPDGSGRNGSIEIRFTRIFVGDGNYPIDATAITETQLQTTKSRGGGDAGGRAVRGALTGAILGRVLGGGSRGAIIGAGAGAAAGAASGGGGGAGGAAILASGAHISCILNSPLVLGRRLLD